MKIGTAVGELQTRKQGTLRLKMATSASCSQEDAVAVYLEDGDIEGATLEEPLEAKTIPQLRWWLVCHGREAPSSLKKPGLIER